MNVTVMHLGKNNNNQHRYKIGDYYLENINIEEDLGVVMDNKVHMSSHCKISNCYPKEHIERRTCLTMEVINSALCSLGKA